MKRADRCAVGTPRLVESDAARSRVGICCSLLLVAHPRRSEGPSPAPWPTATPGAVVGPLPSGSRIGRNARTFGLAQNPSANLASYGRVLRSVAQAIKRRIHAAMASVSDGAMAWVGVGPADTLLTPLGAPSGSP